MLHWSWNILKNVSSNISSGEVLLSLNHGIEYFEFVLRISGFHGWGWIFIRSLASSPSQHFRPGCLSIPVFIDLREPVISFIEIILLGAIAVGWRAWQIFQDADQTELIETFNSTWASNAGNIFCFRYLKEGKYGEERGKFHLKYYKKFELFF